jgi:hypothetical protein
LLKIRSKTVYLRIEAAGLLIVQIPKKFS